MLSDGNISLRSARCSTKPAPPAQVSAHGRQGLAESGGAHAQSQRFGVVLVQERDEIGHLCGSGSCSACRGGAGIEAGTQVKKQHVPEGVPRLFTSRGKHYPMTRRFQTLDLRQSRQAGPVDVTSSSCFVVHGSSFPVRCFTSSAEGRCQK
jgi:hypothetical protein